MAKVSITGPNDKCTVHAAGCADLTKGRTYREGFWTTEVDSLDDLALAIWSDVASDTTEVGSPEHLELCRDYLTDYRIMPCCPTLPEHSEPEVVEFEYIVTPEIRQGVTVGYVVESDTYRRIYLGSLESAVERFSALV